MLLGIHGALNQGSNEIIRNLIAAKDNENKTCVDYAKDSGAYLRFSSAIMFLCNDLSDLGLAQGSFSTRPARDNFLITQLNGSKMYEVYTIGDHEHSFGQYDITDFSF